MTRRPVLEEWSGERLVYLSPRETMWRFGLKGPAERPDLLEGELLHFAAIEERRPRQDGPPAPEAAGFATPEEATAFVRERGRALGADLVGVTHVDPAYVYEGHEVPHRFAIVIAIAMSMDELLRVPRPESNVEYIRVYDAVSRVAVELAEELRARGFPARAHTLRDEDVAMIPHAYAAGIGELGKHGSLINRELGCCFRLSVVTTDLELVEDAPRDDGVRDFCSSCRMCVTYCPGDAISDERDVVRGTERWLVDTERCAPFFSAHYACAVCLQVCPFNAKAFDGAFRDAFVETVRGLDAEELRQRLAAGLPSGAE